MTVSYKLVSVLIADDVRKETSGKDIAIGIYSGVIICTTIPTVLPTFALRFEIIPTKQRYDKVICKIRDPQLDDIMTYTGVIKVANLDYYSAFSMRFSPFIINVTGRYTIHLGMDGPVRKAAYFEVITKESFDTSQMS